MDVQGSGQMYDENTNDLGAWGTELQQQY